MAAADDLTLAFAAYVAEVEADRAAVRDALGGLSDRLAALEPTPVRDDLAVPFVPAGWVEVQVHDWRDAPLGPVTASPALGLHVMQSTTTVNAALAADDAANSLLQKPTLRGNVEVVADPAALHGKALAVHTRRGVYALPGSRTAEGMTNGRVQSVEPVELPLALWQRLRWVGSDRQDKTAAMLWPVEVTDPTDPTGRRYGWTWECDWPERFAGLGTDVSVRHHVAHPDDPQLQARPQQIADVALDPAAVRSYAWFGTLVLPGADGRPARVEYHLALPGQLPRLVHSTDDPRWVPGSGALRANATAGVWALGKALAVRRSEQTEVSAVLVDQVRLYRPA